MKNQLLLNQNIYVFPFTKNVHETLNNAAAHGSFYISQKMRLNIDSATNTSDVHLFNVRYKHIKVKDNRIVSYSN